MAGEREALLAAMGVNVPDSPPYVDPAIGAAAPPNVPSLDTLAHLREQNAAREAAQAKQIREAIAPYAKRAATVGVQALPMLAATPGIGGLVGTTAGIVEGAKPGTLASLAPAREQIREQAGPPLALKAHPGDGDLKPMNTYEDVMPSKTLGQMAGAPSGGGGMGGGGISDAKLRAAQAAQMNGLTAMGDLEREKGLDQALAAQEMSGLRATNAQRIQSDAERQAQIDADAAARHDAFLARQERLANEIGQLRTDPGRLLRNADTGTQFTFAMGAVLGGMNSGPSGVNTSLERLDKLIDRDIQSQLQDIDSKKSSFNARNSLFSQMLADTGDRRLAAMQTRKLMYDAMEMKLKSDAERLGIPELRDNAAIAAQTWDMKRNDLNAQIEQASLQRAQAAAAAAAAAQRAAEERAWQRQVEMIKLDLEQQKVNIDRGKTGTAGSKEDAAAIAETTKRLADDDIVKNRNLVRSLKSKLRPDGTLVGFDTAANAKRVAAGAAIPSVVQYLAPNAVERIALSDDERIARQEFTQLGLLYQTRVTGTGGSDKQMEVITKAFAGANSPAERARAINMAVADLERREGLAYENLTDSQRMELRRREEREGMAAPTPKAEK